MTSSLKPLDILLIDTDLAEAKLIREALPHEGEVRLHLASPEEAPSEIPRDLILLNLDLPDQQGWNVLKNIKKDGKFSYIPVIAFSQSDNPEDVFNAYDLYTNCYILRVLNEAAYLETLRAVLRFWIEVAQIPKR